MFISLANGWQLEGSAAPRNLHHLGPKAQGVNQFSYDNNGNMVGRYSSAMTYDVENRLTRNSHSSSITDSVYNGDSTRPRSLISRLSPTAAQNPLL